MANNKDNTLQTRFLQKIKDLIPVSISFVDELADVLEISNDSAYRRIRGETALTIDEIAVLCNHYKIDLDIGTEITPQATFNYSLFNEDKDFKTYIAAIRDDLIKINNSENKYITYAALDVPIFRYFIFPELSAFKMFFWMKAILNIPEYKDNKFDISLVSNELKDIGKEIYQLYLTIPSTEIWSEETINSLIKQIEFFYDSGNFKSKEDALIVCRQVVELVKNLETQCEYNSKIIKELRVDNPDFTLYNSEVEFGNNCIMVNKGSIKNIYLSFHSFNKMVTTNTLFCNETSKWLSNLVRKSSLISGVAEKQRYQFFKTIDGKINRLLTKIETSKEI